MNFTAGKMAVAMIAIGVGLGGCATRESVQNAQNAADSADRHAGTAQARADEAYGVGNNALGVGNNAMSVGNNALTSAQMANQKADDNTTDVSKLKRKVAYLEWKVLPHHKKHHHHRAPTATEQPKPNNS
jgi:murein lipoprotein